MGAQFIWKHYLLTLLTGPALLLGYWVFVSNDFNSWENVFSTYTAIFSFSIPFSLPALVLYYFFFKALKRLEVERLRAGLLLTGLTIACIYITFLILEEDFLIPFAHAYAFGTAISLLFIHFLWPEKPEELPVDHGSINGEEFDNL